MDVANKRLLVVGANGALGGRLALRLRQAQAYVLGTARSAETSARLDAALDERLLLDLEDAASMKALVDYVGTQQLDGIVIATGVVGFGAPSETSAEDAAHLMRVNHLGPAALITALLPTLRASAAAGSAPVVCSITGVVAEKAFPGMSAYVASKTAHSAWLHAMRLDLRRDGIRVLEVRPGHTETGLAQRPAFGAAPRFPAGLQPDHVAARIADAIRGDDSDLQSADFSG